jgi:hypothetical protein
MKMTAIRLNRRHKFILFLTLIATGASLVMGAGLARAAGIAMLGTALAWILGLNSRVVHWLFLGVGIVVMTGTAATDAYLHHQSVKEYESEVATFERRLPDLAEKYPQLEVERMAQPESRDGAVRVYKDIRSIFVASDVVDEAKAKGWSLAQPKQSDGTRTKTEWVKLPSVALMSFVVPADMTTEQLRAMIKEKYPQLMVKAQTGDVAPHKRGTKWEEDAVAAGVNLSTVPPEEQPGEAPGPLTQALFEHWYFDLLGLLLAGIGLASVLAVKPVNPL